MEFVPLLLARVHEPGDVFTLSTIVLSRVRDLYINVDVVTSLLRAFVRLAIPPEVVVITLSAVLAALPHSHLLAPEIASIITRCLARANLRALRESSS